MLKASFFLLSLLLASSDFVLFCELSWSLCELQCFLLCRFPSKLFSFFQHSLQVYLDIQWMHLQSCIVVVRSPPSVTSNSFFFRYSPSPQCRGLCCIIALLLSGQWLCSLAGLWCNLQNTWASVVCSMGSEWACRVSVLTSTIHSYSQRGVC